MKLNPETIIQREIISYLESIGGRVLRLSSQGTMIRGFLVKNNSKYSPKGMSDLAFISNGSITFLEVKTPSELTYIRKHHARILEGNFAEDDKKLNRYRDQIMFISEMRCFGCLADFVSSVADVRALLDSSVT